MRIAVNIESERWNALKTLLKFNLMSKIRFLMSSLRRIARTYYY